MIFSQTSVLNMLFDVFRLLLTLIIIIFISSMDK